MIIIELILQADKEKKKKPKKKEEPKQEEAPAPAPEPEPEAPKPPSQTASQRASSRGSRKAKRSGSSVFSMFSQKQVAEFKEVRYCSMLPHTRRRQSSGSFQTCRRLNCSLFKNSFSKMKNEKID